MVIIKYMKIVLAAGIFYPDVGGPAIHTRKIAEALAVNGWGVVVVAYGDYDKQENFPFQVKRVSRRYFGPIRWLIYFFKIFINAFRARAIYAFDPSAAGIPAFLAAKILRKRFVIRIGGDPIWERAVEKGKRFLPLKEYYDAKFYLKDKPVLFKTIRWMLKRADQIVVYSQFFKDFYQQFYKVQPHKITIIKNPISKKESAESVLGHEPTILFAGRFVAYKNLALVIEVFSAIRKRFPTGKLVLIGHGPEKESLETKIHNLQLSNFVEIKPQMDQGQLFQEIRRAAVCIAPALTEFNPNFILESLSLGKPVLISRGNGLSVDLPQDFLFDPQSEEELGQKLSNFFNPDFYKKAVEAVQKLPMEQTWEKVVAAHLELIKSLIL